MGRKRKLKSQGQQKAKSTKLADQSTIWVKLDRGVWWPGYVLGGKATFFEEEKEVGIPLKSNNWCVWSDDAEKIRKYLGKLSGAQASKFKRDVVLARKKAKCQQSKADVMYDRRDTDAESDDDSDWVDDGTPEDEDIEEESADKDDIPVDDRQQISVDDENTRKDEVAVDDRQQISVDDENTRIDEVPVDDRQQISVDDENTRKDEVAVDDRQQISEDDENTRKDEVAVDDRQQISEDDENTRIDEVAVDDRQQISEDDENTRIDEVPVDDRQQISVDDENTRKDEVAVDDRQQISEDDENTRKDEVAVDDRQQISEDDENTRIDEVAVDDRQQISEDDENTRIDEVAVDDRQQISEDDENTRIDEVAVDDRQQISEDDENTRIDEVAVDDRQQISEDDENTLIDEVAVDDRQQISVDDENTRIDEVAVDDRQQISDDDENTRIDEVDSWKDDMDDGQVYAQMDETQINRATDNTNIYVRKVLKSEAKGKQPKKKLDRVYNTRHSCYICKKLYLHIIQHIRQKHKTTAAELLDEKKYDYMRSKGDHVHNKEVLKSGKGELILARRPKGPFESTDFGPCPRCYEWMKISALKVHQKTCKQRENSSTETAAIEGNIATITGDRTLPKKTLQTKSDVLAGRIKGSTSAKLVKEVFSIMTRDDISEVAKNDDLIVCLGESWLNRSVGNPKGKYYSSQHMRLMARLLLNLRKMESNDDDDQCQLPLWDFLVPVKFDLIVKAAVQCALPYMDDVDELKSPSNAIKLKYDLKRVIDCKWGLVQTSGLSHIEAGYCDTLDRLMQIHWGEKVTRLARTVLTTRGFTKEIQIPSPEDIEKVTKYTNRQVQSIDLSVVDYRTYRRAVDLVQTRLLMFNKRRSGEIDGIKLTQYVERKQNLEDVDESLVGELSELEHHLLQSHDLMVVRGKRCRPVPVLIPNNVNHCLEYIADGSNRSAVGVGGKKWLFATTGVCSARSYDAMSSVVGECSLKAPNRITSVSLRKYMATLTQMLDLNDGQLQWACDHLGHTKGVHLAHYRQMSGFIERVKMAKLILIQDMNLTGSLKGRKLEDKQVDDVILKTLREEFDEQPDTENEPDTENVDISGVSLALADSPDNDIESLTELQVADDEYQAEQSTVKKNNATVNRVRWSQLEIDEIQKYFSEYLKTKTCPKKAQCLKAIQKSKEAGGKLGKRYWHTIVKKISNMNKKK